MDNTIIRLYKAGRISAAVAKAAARDADYVKKSVFRQPGQKAGEGMMTFKYSAVSRDGAKVSGIVEAFDEFAAVSEIKESSTEPVEVHLTVTFYERQR